MQRDERRARRGDDPRERSAAGRRQAKVAQEPEEAHASKAEHEAGDERTDPIPVNLEERHERGVGVAEAASRSPIGTMPTR